MIRQATDADIPALAAMGARFHAASDYANLLTPTPEAVERTLRGLLAGGVIFVGEQDGVLAGAILGMVMPHFLSGELVCGELAWWVDPAHRGSLGVRLLRRLEEWARAQGAVRMAVAAPAGAPRVDALYLRTGYCMVEKAFMKVL